MVLLQLKGMVPMFCVCAPINLSPIYLSILAILYSQVLSSILVSGDLVILFVYYLSMFSVK